MKTDLQLQKDVQDELKWEPSVTPSEIGVSVNNGVVTLGGTVPTYAEKCAAERAAQRVEGVKAVAENIQVKLTGIHKRSDTEIAEAAVSALKWHVFVPVDVQVTVENSCITLRGQVNWEYQRSAALNAVRYLPGVRGVSNDITIKPTVRPSEVKDEIEKALKRDAEVDAEHIAVSADGGKVRLSGSVHTWREHEEAGRAAWKAPGVTAVVNNIAVSY
jgi:osmotically-inducible protein OsmY